MSDRLSCLTLLRLLLAALLAAPALAQMPGQTPPPGAAAGQPSAPVVLALEIRGAISPATTDYLQRGLARARERRAALVVVELDTPGGLDTAMRAMIQEILASPIPVATYVAPTGARAASAGTYLLYASHVAAMAPATNLGAATPVQIGAAPQPQREPPAKGENDAGSDTMTRKQINDAAAYLRSLAQYRGRNADWAEQAVRESVSISAEEALRLRAIDLIANDIDDLLTKIDGKAAKAPAGTIVIATRGAQVVFMAPDWRQRMLAVIADPSVALLLMMAGIWGLIFELSNPGLILPGVVGAVCLALAAFALQILPVNYAGLLLMLLGIGFMVTEAFFVPSFGALGVGGLIAFVAGGLILFDPAETGYAVPVSFIAAVALAFGLLLAVAARLALRAHRRPVASGSGELVGLDAEVVSWQADGGWISLRGELWAAESDAPLAAGDPAVVIAADGRVLKVRKKERPA